MSVAAIGQAKVEMRLLSKYYDTPKAKTGDAGPLTVLDGLSLTVRKGEFLTIVGPSGCGKTTLLRVVAGLISADKGEVLLDGRVVSKPDPTVSVVFQSIGLVPWKTVWENVALGLELQSHRALTPQQKDHVQRHLALVGLDRFEHYYPSQISGGMQQRVGLARALARQPELLLMDEPFGALDAQTRAILQDELLTLWDQTSATVFFITHDLDEAIYLSDRVVIMSRRPGRVKQVLEVNLPRPRFAYDVRAAPEFIELRNVAWASIKEEIGRL